MKKAVALVSGGLDSILAVCLAKDMGIEVICVHFRNPFSPRSKESGTRLSRRIAEKLKLEFMDIPLGKEYLEIVSAPKYGYGKNINPCIDCRIHQFNLAKKIMKEKGASFIITGEVAGQRPMSQNRRTMKIIEKESGLEGLVLRPLSAGVLEATLPENEGWIERGRLLSVTGRSRTVQKKLVEKYGLDPDEYASPAGGCRLTYAEYSNKVRDIIEQKGSLDIEDIKFFDLGRHFRISKKFKLIAGRNEEENNALESLAGKNHMKLYASSFKGPLCIGIGEASGKDIEIAASICGFYSKWPPGVSTECLWQSSVNSGKVIAEPFGLSELDKYRV